MFFAKVIPEESFELVLPGSLYHIPANLTEEDGTVNLSKHLKGANQS